MRLSNRVLLASLNRDKFEEFLDLMKAYPEIELVRPGELMRNAEKIGFVENYSTYLENAMAKARVANHAAHYPSLADDSGLEVAALEGKPGVRSHRYAPPRPGVHQDQANRDLLLSSLKGAQDRSAQFVCALALVIEGVSVHAVGKLEGHIAEAPRGNLGFGYDPIFIPKGYNRTLAEMSFTEKNKISHRSVALTELMKTVRTLGITFAKP